MINSVDGSMLIYSSKPDFYNSKNKLGKLRILSLDSNEIIKHITARSNDTHFQNNHYSTAHFA